MQCEMREIMLADLHSMFGHLLHTRGQIPSEVEIRLEVPKQDWTDSLTRPTINAFLFSLRENTDKRETNMETFRGNGIAQRRMRPRRIDLHYMLSVLTTEIADEHELLWRVLATLMRHQDIPEEVLPDSLKRVEPKITARVGDEGDGVRLLDIWNALGTAPHPAVHYIVTAPLDLDVAMEAPLVLTRTVRYKDVSEPARIVGSALQIGGTVRDKTGDPLGNVIVRTESSAGEGCHTDAYGRFVLQRVKQGGLTLNVTRNGKTLKMLKVHVPADSYDIVVDE